MPDDIFPQGPITGRPVSFAATVTPADAAMWLSDRLPNRHISIRHRDAIARDIEAGNYHLTHQGIAFTWDAGRWRMHDGQHRMAAVVKAGRPIETLVTFGAASAGVDAMLRVRQFGHQLAIEGTPQASQIAAVARLITLWEVWGEAPVKGTGRTPTWDEMRKTLDAHPCIAATIALPDRIRRACGLRASVAGWFRFATAHSAGRDCVSPDDDWFMERLVDGAGLNAGHPALTLRNRLGSDRDFRRDEFRLSAACVYAWNAYRDGRELTIIKVPGNLTPATFPEVR